MIKRIYCLVALLLIGSTVFCGCSAENGYEKLFCSSEQDLYLYSLPEDIRKLYERNPETADFVFSYKELKGTRGEVDLSEYSESDEVPLFMQWDKRWGYMEYSGDCVALTGCGPVCLSMVAFHLTKDENMSPDRIVEFAVKNNYYQEGYGSLWTLISEGGEKLGLSVEELPLVESIITEKLEQGIPIICVMGSGDFTSTGHFVVMRKYENGKIYINDPNSFENSEKGWEYESIAPQIKNLWACSL